MKAASPALAEALATGTAPAAADPVEVGAVAYVLRTPGWAALVATAAADLDRAATAAESSRSAETVAQLQESLAAVRAQGREELARLRDEVAAARRRRRRCAASSACGKGGAATRRRGGDAGRGPRRRPQDRPRRLPCRGAEAELRRRPCPAARGRGGPGGGPPGHPRGPQHRGRPAAAAAGHGGRRGAGLRRELALPPATTRPADLVEGADAAGPGGRGASGRCCPTTRRCSTSCSRCRRCTSIVDGYNVTKTGYPDLPLEEQRRAAGRRARRPRRADRRRGHLLLRRRDARRARCRSRRRAGCGCCSASRGRPPTS